MTIPPPVELARMLAPSLQGLDWGIGGSVLMWTLGLEPAPRDLDVVTTVEHFETVRDRVTRHLGTPADVPHSSYQSRGFARFAASASAPMDLFAGIRAKTSRGVVEWAFDPRSLVLKDGLPWMNPADWVELYELFDRPTRAKALQEYLAEPLR